ncbi:MAG: 4-hydroxy-2-oxoheptanedioate aldolase [Chloroflexota bacterium]|nr:4-hydroxy-2-oxoheptanedioate aldolase [Chloroflexota bacterium]
METNRLKHRLAAGELGLLSGNFESPDMVDFAGSLKLYDGAWIDMEHGAVTVQGLGDLTRAADLWGMTSVVRVRSLDPAIIGLTLSQGAQGVIVPHVSTREQAELVVSAVKVPPLGRMGASGGRRSYGTTVAEHMEHANEESFVGVMIEDVEGIDNLPEMLQVQHIDIYFVSHYDLALSMGLQADVHDAALVATFDGAVQQIVAAGRVAAAAVGEQELDKYIAMGVRCIKAPRWQALVAQGSLAFADRVRAAQA